MDNNSMKPPPQLDGTKVLYWAWSGDEPFGVITDGTCALEIYGFAICICDEGVIYRYSCDRQWETQSDIPYETPQEAMDAFYPQYLNRPIHWIKYDDTDIDALLDECKKVEFYREFGGRRIIQKIFDHLRQHNCHGMSVRSETEDTWLLSIKKKDISLASEIAEQNVAPKEPKAP
jgi:hypothetical protein